MRVLVDECLPRQLRHWLLAEQPSWAVMTVQDCGWASMKNGTLLREADGAFDVLVTADKNMHHQQNFVGLTISVLVFPTNRAKLVRDGVGAIVKSLSLVGKGEKAVMFLDGGLDWNIAQLLEVVPKQGVSHHLFRGPP